MLLINILWFIFFNYDSVIFQNKLITAKQRMMRRKRKKIDLIVELTILKKQFDEDEKKKSLKLLRMT